MAMVIRMPEILAGATEAAIQTWLVREGEAVAVGTPLAEIETDKATVEYAAESAGVVLKMLVEEGMQIAVGDPIAIMGAPGESADEPPSRAERQRVEPEPESSVETRPSPEVGASRTDGAARSATSAAAAPDTSHAPSPSEKRVFASPLVRRLSRERGIDLSVVTGSGPQGRIVRRDLDRLGEETATAAATGLSMSPREEGSALREAEFTEVSHTGMRRAIARRLTESKSTVPHFYLVAHCHVDALLALRDQLNAVSPVKISVNDFVLKAAAGAFSDVPDANAIWTDSAIRRFDSVEVAVAVSIEGGLVTPVIRGIADKSLTEISAETSALAERARAGRLKQQELEGGCFAVSNLGMFGIEEFTAIINPPQSAILAVGRAAPKPVVEDGALAVATVMTVTLSADHRVLDGALAAQWLVAFQRRIENPLSILI